MSGAKLDKAKSDAKELVDFLLSNQNNHVALITFDTSSEIVSDFTNNKNEMMDMIEILSAYGTTNYNAGLQNVLEVMEGYQKDDNHDIVTLFLTDGYNEDTPNQVATYHIIKDKYPYMTINGIQYEMGRDIIQEIIDISDNQWVADQETLNGVLFDAVITQLPYETFIVSDYINKDYFYLDNISDVTITSGNAELQEENGLQKVIWTLDDNITGFNANMKIKLQLKSEYHNGRGFYPTNDHETINYKIIDEDEENVSSTLTPVLKRAYNVIYDANAPEGCNLPDIPSEEHYVHETVTKRSDTLVCEGYIFRGYQFDEVNATDITIINNDTFIMPGHDVTIRGTWTRQGLVKSMDGTVRQRLNGTLINQRDVSTITFGKSISRDSFESITTVDNIEVPSNAIDSWDVSQERNGSVIAWYTDNDQDSKYELYIGQEDGVKANLDSSFYYFRNVELIDLTNFDISNVTNMSQMFYLAGYNATTFNIVNLSNWDTSKITNMNSMFSCAGYRATTWNIGNLSNWNTSSVTNMRSMFSATAFKASTFELDLSSWDTSNVTTMEGMFSNAGYTATTFNIGNLSNWNTSSVTSMSYMFSSAAQNATTFNIGNLSNWNTSSVTSMRSMFSSAGRWATTFNIGNLSNWNTSNVTDMQSMFSYAAEDATTWNIGNLSNWDVSKVTNMSSMFSNAGHKSATWNIGNLSNWDVSNVENMESMFNQSIYSAPHDGNAATTVYIGNLNNWNVSKVTNMYRMFTGFGYNATTFNIGNLSNWDTSKVTTMEKMFSYAGYSATTWNNIGTLKIYANNIDEIFRNAKNAKATLNIYSNPSYAWNDNYAFTGAATVQGSGITVNYSSTTTNIDDIIATKSSNSNVVKGVQLD